MELEEICFNIVCLPKRFQAQYGHAYGRPLDSRHNNNGRGNGNVSGPDEEDTKLKALIKEIKSSVEETKGFWTTLPYDMCQVLVVRV